MSNHAFTLLAQESVKSASSQNVSQTVSNRVIWFEKVKSGLNYSTGTGLLKSASGLVVSQTDAFDSGGSCESKYILKLIGTGILEVCEWSDSVADALDSGGSWESKYMLKLIGTGILEVCEWSDSVADRRFRLGRVLGVEI